MALWDAFTRAVYKETVLVWALGMYGTGAASVWRGLADPSL